LPYKSDQGWKSVTESGKWVFEEIGDSRKWRPEAAIGGFDEGVRGHNHDAVGASSGGECFNPSEKGGSDEIDLVWVPLLSYYRVA
jgi:hypothetical protein